MALASNSGDGYIHSLQFTEGYPADAASVVNLGDRLAGGVYPRVKRVLDLALACSLLLALAPLLLLLALVIALDSPGPVLFRQARVGKDGRLFEMLKFRTMSPERRLHNVGPPPGEADRRLRHKSAGDPRVTRVGRLLRRTCLDELPQLLNVLRGDMSLVGPRPELPIIVAAYEPWQHGRHLVPPGITGWWQVNRVGDCLMHEATELDIYYVHNCSILLDLWILARTLGAIVAGSGAY
jgi:lipopolysaccharide/colanic/teichoic acid biosynthesis glycosyltransferase